MTRQGASRIVHHERPRFFLLQVHGGKNTTDKKKTHIKRPTRQQTEHHTMVVVPRIRYLQTFKHVRQRAVNPMDRTRIVCATNGNGYGIP